MAKSTFSRSTSNHPLDIGVYGARGIPSTYSGYETFLTLLLPALVAHGDHVTIYCRSGEGFDNSEFRGVKRRVLPALPGKNFSTLSHGLLAAIAARAARHDVVLVVNVANAAFCAIGRYTGQPVVLNVDGQEWLRGKWGTTARRIFHWSAQIAGRTSSALIADGAAMAEVYAEEFSSDTTVIPYCVTTGEWSPDPSAVEALGLEPFGYLLIAGRHNPENNIDAIVERYVESDMRTPIVVLGTANYDSPVTRRIARLAAVDDRVRMLGHVDGRSTFFDLVHHAALYLHGHSVGGTNPSLIEAMGTGARIAALDTPFSRETLGVDGDFFRIHAHSDPHLVADSTDGVADVIRRILTAEPSIDIEQRHGAAYRASQVYGTDAVVDAYREILGAAATSRRSVRLPTRWNPNV